MKQPRVWRGWPSLVRKRQHSGFMSHSGRRQDQTEMVALVLQRLMILEHHMSETVWGSSYRGSHLAILRYWHRQWLGCRTQILCLLAEVFPTESDGSILATALNTVPWRRCPHNFDLLPSVCQLRHGCDLIPSPQAGPHPSMPLLSLSWGAAPQSSHGVQRPWTNRVVRVLAHFISLQIFFCACELDLLILEVKIHLVFVC